MFFGKKNNKNRRYSILNLEIIILFSIQQIESDKYMKIGLFTRNSKAWCSTQLINEIKKKNIEPVCFRFSDLMARVKFKPEVTINGKIDVLTELSAIIIRPIGRGSLDEIIFRLDLLHRLERLGLPIINSPPSIEKAVDKYCALAILEENNICVPRTIVTENPNKAMDAFYERANEIQFINCRQTIFYQL